MELFDKNGCLTDEGLQACLLYTSSQYTVLPMFHLGAFICLFSWAHAGWALNVSSDIRNFYKELKRMPSQAMAVVPVIMLSLIHISS